MQTSSTDGQQATNGHHTDWHQFLSRQGATFAAGQEAVFSDTQAGFHALQHGAALVPLCHWGLIRFTGPDTEAFLQGQLSSDVRKLAAGNAAQYSSYSTPKGRMLASLLLTHHDGDYWLSLPLDMLEKTRKRLAVYVLRSKTRAEDASAGFVQLGLAGPDSARLVSGLLAGAQPPALHQVAGLESAWVQGLENGQFLITAATARAEAVWQQLQQAGAVAAGAALWTLTRIRAGVVSIGEETEEQFVPQMANMDLIEAVSFKKGCYPGQEIVARTQYLGKLKRRCFRFQSPLPAMPGQDVFSPEMNGQPSGKIALAAPAAEGHYEVLAVVQLSSLEQGLHLGAPDGPLLTAMPQPYPMPAG